MRFSQRIGMTSVKTIIQIESIDMDLRNSLWNALIIKYWDPYSTLVLEENEYMTILIKILWVDLFKKPIDSIDYHWRITLESLRKYFYQCRWFEIYDFIEFVANNFPLDHVNEDFIKYSNNVLEKELSGYRFVGSTITQITDKVEIQGIEDALQTSLTPIKEHLSCALGFLSDRKNPDYRNSIKESISAVEAISKLISEDDKATLGQALKKLEDKIEIHPALKEAFAKLYGYTSDKRGIRHSLLDVPDLQSEDAKFMLVSCSAFINYLIEKSSKVGIKLE